MNESCDCTIYEFCEKCRAKKETPTNEPKMPEVIYASERSEFESFHKAFDYDTNSRRLTPYHHDDKVQELKDALRDLMEIIKNEYHFRTPDKWDKITKASNLLK